MLIAQNHQWKLLMGKINISRKKLLDLKQIWEFTKIRQFWRHQSLKDIEKSISKSTELVSTNKASSWSTNRSFFFKQLKIIQILENKKHQKHNFEFLEFIEKILCATNNQPPAEHSTLHAEAHKKFHDQSIWISLSF